MAKYDEKDAFNLADNTIRKLNMIMRLAALNLFRQVILKTPVREGRARSNWVATVGDISREVTDNIKSEAQTVNDMIEKITGGQLKKGFFLTNNLPYIQKLEYGGYPNPAKTGTKTVNGYSKQAPAGMVRISLEQIKNELSEIIEDVIENQK